MIDPYRILFPLGLLFTLAGALLWPLHSAGLLPYPAVDHRGLMIQGFEHCFILGFLLTAMPSFLRSSRCHPGELVAAAGCMTIFGAGTLTGTWPLAQAGYLATFLVLLEAAARRIPRAPALPPDEFRLAGFGLLLGALGSLLLLGASLGVLGEPWSRFGLRVITHGMILALVLGVGGLLVPAFTAAVEHPVMAGLARPEERIRKRRLHLYAGAGLAVSLGLDGAGQIVWGSWIRAIIGTSMLVSSWGVARPVGRADRLSLMLRSAGWLLLAGLWAAAFLPARPLLGAHLMFVGGYGFLTMGIATRVVVRHGSHPGAAESDLLSRTTIALAILALALRLAAEGWPAVRLELAALSGVGWVGAWISWARAALPRIVRVGKRIANRPHP